MKMNMMTGDDKSDFGDNSGRGIGLLRLKFSAMMVITITQAMMMMMMMMITITQAIVFYIPRCIWLSMEGGLMNFLVKGTQGR